MIHKKKLRLLLIGFLSNNVSGSSIMFKQSVELLSSYDWIDVQVVNTARPTRLTSNWLINLATALKTTMFVLLHLRKIDVVTFHASCPAVMLYGPVLFVLTKIFRRPLVIRLLGGTMEQEYELLSTTMRYLIKRSVLSVDLLLLETKHLVSYFDQQNAHCVRWYPNSRKIVDLSNMQQDVRTNCKRFVFLGRVVEEKGIGVILESVQYMTSSEISVYIFGSLDGHYTAEHINLTGKGVVCYKGILTSEQVRYELSNYDALILPTFYHGEGYPGVVLEAYSQGIPVIATQWRSIPEIVDEDSGILIPVHSAKALAQAMEKLYTDKALYARLQSGALSKRLMFSEHFWSDRFTEWCLELSKGMFPSHAKNKT